MTNPGHFLKAAQRVLGRSDIQVLTSAEGEHTIIPEVGAAPISALDQTMIGAINAEAASIAATKTQEEAISAIAAERQRRLEMGFDYDFGDARGVHRIGTTQADMAGWREVDDLADVLSRSGQGAASMNIVTNTGPVEITADEWLTGIKAAFAAFRQPLWAASFALQAMDPIPADYATNDAYWP